MDLSQLKLEGRPYTVVFGATDPGLATMRSTTAITDKELQVFYGYFKASKQVTLPVKVSLISKGRTTLPDSLTAATSVRELKAANAARRASRTTLSKFEQSARQVYDKKTRQL
ncbi:hypothetical protein DFQ27_006768 [Actinomortierella ambigua]|uniref:Uncharacterized protein n=1 Tax=Actinomortierella ambigua TaxID=1343610 RepID=A0A9P6QKM1_9FUNG|nr:hypothetical protein DFQ27_006768 [Actinomortierella ambigua]